MKCKGIISFDLISSFQFARSGERLHCCGPVADVFNSWEDVEVFMVSSLAHGGGALDVGQLVAVYIDKHDSYSELSWCRLCEDHIVEYIDNQG